MKKLYNSQALALLCVSEIGDVLSLSTLAQNLDLMRHSRIVVLLHSPDSNLGEFLRIISEQATSKQFVNLVVLHSSSSESRDSSTLYRMHPYPSPTFTRVTNFSDERIFLNFWTDFQRKPAVILHELRTPASFISVDRRTGKKELQGSSNTFLKEFAEKHNIQLQLLNPFSELGIAKTMEILTMAREGQIDLPNRPSIYIMENLQDFEFVSTYKFTTFFLVVPCSQEMSVRHVYLGLRSYFIIILCSYILFEVIETLIIYATNWIYQRRANISYSRFVLNLRAFAGILGLPMPRRRYRTSISLQQIIMLMCFCGLIFTAFFNANLSTLLTKHPYNKEIRNFDELRDSGLEVLLDENFKIGLEPKFSGVGSQKLISNVKFVEGIKLEQLLLSLDPRYALQAYKYIWEIIVYYQNSHSMNVLCKWNDLNITGEIPLGFMLKKNSIYREALNDYVSRALSYGLDKYWDSMAMLKLMEMMQPFQDPRFSANNEEHSALLFEDLFWLWKLLGICHTLASLVLIGELTVARWQRKRARELEIIEV